MSFLFVKLRSDRRIVLAIALSLLAGFSIVRSGAAENLPDMRPVLIGSEKDALINLIDTKKLIASDLSSSKGAGIAPQSVYPADHRDDYIANPAGESEAGSVELSLSVDASGNLKDVHVVNETPPGAKLGEAAVRVMRQHIYLPAFRSGKPVDSINQIHFTFTHGGGAWR